MTAAPPPGPPPSQPPFRPPYGPPSRGRRPLGVGLAGFVAGLIVAGLVIGVLFWTDTIGGSGSGSDSAAGGTSGSGAVSMPDELGGLKTETAAMRAKGAEQKSIDSAETRLDHMRSLTTKQYAEAYPGAGIGVQAYANESLDFMPVVIAIRADSTPILANAVAQDPADAGLAVNQSEIKVVGDVRCTIYHTQAVMAGDTPDPDQVAASLCQETAHGFTVFVTGPGNGTAGVTQMVNLTKAAFDTLS